MLTVQPFDPTPIKAIEKAIQESDLGLNALERRQADPAADPAADRGAAQGARQGRPALRRGGHVAVRNVRRDVMNHLKELVENGDVGDDEERRAEEQVQKLTDEHTGTIDELIKHKEAEIMEV